MIATQDSSMWPKDIGQPSGSIFKRNSKIYNSNKDAIKKYLNSQIGDKDKQIQLCNKYNTHAFVVDICKKKGFVNELENTEFINPTMSTVVHNTKAFTTQNPSYESFTNDIDKLNKQIKLLHTQINAQIHKKTFSSIEQNRIIFIFTLHIDDKTYEVCNISKKNDNGILEHLMYYVVLPCRQSQREHIKKKLPHSSFYVYKSWDNQKYVVCTSSKCYMEGENDELKFEFTKLTDGVKYFILPISVNPLCNQVRNPYSGQEKCDTDQNYDKIFFRDPKYYDICGNTLLYGSKENPAYESVGPRGMRSVSSPEYAALKSRNPNYYYSELPRDHGNYMQVMPMKPQYSEPEQNTTRYGHIYNPKGNNGYSELPILNSDNTYMIVARKPESSGITNQDEKNGYMTVAP